MPDCQRRISPEPCGSRRNDSYTRPMRTDSSQATDALLERLRGICAGLPGSEEYVMVHHPAFRVGKKPFVIIGMEQMTKGATLSINFGREAQHQLLGDARFSRTPYIGQHGWVTIAYGQLRQRELPTLVLESYRRVANRKQLAALKDGTAPAPKPARKKGRAR